MEDDRTIFNHAQKNCNSYFIYKISPLVTLEKSTVIMYKGQIKDLQWLR